MSSGGDLTLDAGGDIDFQGVKDFVQESRIKSKSSWAWMSDKGKGHTDETLIQSQIDALGEQTIRAAGQIHIDLPEINATTVRQTLDALVEVDPGLAWLKEMEQRGDIDWRKVKEFHDEWSYSHSGMGPAVAIVVAIVTAVAAGPAFSAMVGELGAGTAAMAAAVPAVGSTAAVSAGWANVAITAALTSATANATINLVNTQGNLGQTLKNTFSGDALKGYAVAAGVAGLTSYTDMWGREMTPSGNTRLIDLSERAKAYALNTTVKGVLTGADSSKDWATVAGAGLAGELYQYWVGRDPDIKPGVDRPEGAEFTVVPEDGFLRVPTVLVDGAVREGKNIGLNQSLDIKCLTICHGNWASNVLNMIPGFNSFGTLHDVGGNWFEANDLWNVGTNLGTMPPALAVTYGALVNQYYWLKLTVDQNKEERK
jgi:filamentous hemagglutinin